MPRARASVRKNRSDLFHAIPAEIKPSETAQINFSWQGGDAAPLDFSPELLQSLRLPAGFKIEKFAEGLKTPRVIVVGPNGGLYVSSRDEGTITFLSDRGGTADGRRIVVQKPNVHGIAVREGELFYITIREIFAAPISTDGSIGTERRIASDLPDAGQHPNRTIAFGLDGFLYVSVGSTCNDCEENNPENATLLKMRPDGSGREIVAIGFAKHNRIRLGTPLRSFVRPGQWGGYLRRR